MRRVERTSATAFDPKRLLALDTPVQRFTRSERDAMLYAAGIGFCCHAGRHNAKTMMPSAYMRRSP